MDEKEEPAKELVPYDNGSNGTDYFINVIDRIRTTYKISKSIKTYLFSGWKFRSKLLKQKFSKINYIDMDIEENDKEFKNRNIDGILKKDYYTIVSLSVNGGYSYIVFTNDIDKFEKEYFNSIEFDFVPEKGLFRLLHTSCGTIMEKVSIENITRPILNENLFDELTEEIDNFMKKENVYKQNHLDYKRGILLYGLPGNGKTCFIKHLLKGRDAISIICDAKNEEDINFVTSFVKDSDADKLFKIIVLEDIDRAGSDYIRSKFLNLIDGIQHLNRVIFIATSNNPNDLDHALTNRPSRFDGLYEIESPNEESRRKLLLFFFPDAKKGELDEAVSLSDKFRGAHFKEIFLITKLYDCSIISAIKRLNKKFKAFKEFKNIDYLG